MTNNSEGIMARYKKYLTNQQKKKLRSLYAGYQQTTADERREAYLQARRAADRSAAAASSMGLGGGYEARKQAATDAELDKYGMQLNRQADAAFESNAVVPMANQTIKAQNEAARKAYERRKKAARRAYQDALNKQKQQQTARLTKQERDRLKYYRYGQQYMVDALTPGITAPQDAQKPRRQPIPVKIPVAIPIIANGQQHMDDALVPGIAPRNNTHNRDKAYQYAQEWVDEAGATRPKTKRERDRAKANRYAQDWAGNAPKESPLKKNNGSAVNPKFDISPKQPVILPPEYAKEVEARVKDIAPNDVPQVKLDYLNEVNQYANLLQGLNEAYKPVGKMQDLANQYQQLVRDISDPTLSVAQRKQASVLAQQLGQEYREAYNSFNANKAGLQYLQNRVERAYGTLQIDRAVLGRLGVEMTEDDIGFNTGWAKTHGYIPETPEELFIATRDLIDNETETTDEFWKRAKNNSAVLFGYGDENGNYKNALGESTIPEEERKLVLDSQDETWMRENGFGWVIDGVAQMLENSNQYATFAQAAKAFLEQKEADEWQYFEERNVRRVLTRFNEIDDNEKNTAMSEGAKQTGIDLDRWDDIHARWEGVSNYKFETDEDGQVHAVWKKTGNVLKDNALNRNAGNYVGGNIAAGLIERKLGLPSRYLNTNTLAIMTKEDAAFINYCYGMGDKETARQYIYQLAELANQLVGKEKADKIAELPWGIRFAREAMDQFSYGVSSFHTGLADVFTDHRTPTTVKEVKSSAITENQRERGWGGAADVINPALVSAGNMAPSIALGYAGGAAAAALSNTAAGASTLGVLATEGLSHAGTISMGLSAGGKAKQEALRMGYGKDAANVYGIINGISETCLQEIMGGVITLGQPQWLEALGDSILNSVKNPVARVMVRQALNAASETTEEVMQDILDPVFKGVSLDEKYLNDHPDAKQLLNTALSTVISTLLMNGMGGDILNTAKTETAIQRLSESYGLSVADARFMLNTYNDFMSRKGGDLDIEDYNKFNELASVIESNLPASVIDKIQKGETDLISYGASRYGAESGKLDRNIAKFSEGKQTETLDATDHTAEIANLKGKAKARYLIDASPTGKIGDLYFTTVDGKAMDVKNMGLTQKTNFNIAQKLAKAFPNIKIVAHDNLYGIDGVNHVVEGQAPEIHVSLNGSAMVMTTAAHELLHQVEKTDTKAYKNIQSYLTTLLDESEIATTEKNVASKYGIEYTVDDKGNKVFKDEKTQKTFESEVAAHLVEKVLTDDSFLDRIIRDSDPKNRTVKAKLINGLKDVIDRVTKALRGEPTVSGKLYKLQRTIEKAYREMSKADLTATKTETEEADFEAVEKNEKQKEEAPATEEKSQLPITDATNEAEAEDASVSYRIEDDPNTLRELNNGKTVKVYRAMQLIDGKLYPPMAAKVKDESGKATLQIPTEFNQWYRSDERPDLVDEKGKFRLNKGNGSSIDAAYNPYWHTSASPLNDQFSSAWNRPNLVVVEGEIPASELTSGYKADKAKDSVGETKWHAGPVASKLKGDKARRVFLSRWFRATRVVSDAEVASIVADTLRGEDVSVPSNVVTPSLLAELRKQGVPIEEIYGKGGAKNQWRVSDEDITEEKATEAQTLVDERFAKNQEMQTLKREVSTLEQDAGYRKLYDGLFDVNPLNENAFTEKLDELKAYSDEIGLTKKNERLESLQKELRENRKKYEEAEQTASRYKELSAIRKSGMEEADYFRRQALSEFGTTPYFYDAGYILPDGRMLNFSGEKGKHYGSRGQDHRAIGTIYESSAGTEAMLRFMQDGNIRIMAETPGVDIAANGMPTSKQLEKIKDFAWQNGKKEGFFAIDFTNERGDTIDSLEYLDGVNPRQIVNDIRNYFEKGKTQEPSLVQQFHSDDMMRVSDSEYLSLAEKYRDGTATEEEKAELEKRVEEAAKKAGYTIKAYHGTPNAKSEINPNYIKAVQQIYSILNPNGQSLEKPGDYGTESHREFWKFDAWFRQPKIKNRARQLYSIPDNVIRVFNDGPIRKFTKFNTKELGFHSKAGSESVVGAYFTTNPNFANTFRESYEVDFAGNIRKVSNGPGDLYTVYLKPDNIIKRTPKDSFPGNPDELIVFDPSDIKSADPVTYDDNGDIIPLSERFNAGNEDIRYRISDYSEDETIVGTPIDTAAVRRAVKTGKEQTTKDGYTVKIDTGEGNKYAVTVSRDGEVINTREGVANEELKGADIERTAAALMRNIKKGRANSNNTSTSDIYIEKGEIPARDVNVPKSARQGMKTSKLARTIAEAPGMTDESVDELMNKVYRGFMSYKPDVNQESMDKALKKIEDNMAEAVVEWNQVANSGRILTPDDVALGSALMVSASQSGDVNSAMEIASQLQDLATTGGKLVQSFRMIKRLGAAGEFYYINRQVAKINAELEKQAKGYKLTLNEELVRNLLNARDYHDIREATEALRKDLGQQLKPTLRDWLTAWRYTAMLGNAKTLVRNDIGNAAYVPVIMMDNVLNAIGQTVTSAVSKGKFEKTTKLFAGKQYRDFANWDWNDTVKYDIKGNKYSEGQLGDIKDYMRYDTHAKGILKPGAWVFEKWRSGTQKFMEDEALMGDMAFKKLHYQHALATRLDQLKVDVKALQDVLTRARNNETFEQGTREAKLLAVYEAAAQYAVSEANRNTYNDINAFASFVSQMSRTMYDKEVGGKHPLRPLHYALEGVLPFKNTPANIVARAAEHSPIGLAKTLTLDIGRVAKGKISGEQFTHNLSAGLTGSALFALGAILAKAGILHGGLGYDDKDDKEKKRRGHQSYSLEIGNTSITLDWLAPECIPLFMGVELFEQLGGMSAEDWSEKGLKALLNVTTGAFEPMLNMSMLSGINALFEGFTSTDDLQGIEKVAATVATSYLTQFQPTILGQFARTIDPTRRTTYYDKNAKIPPFMQKFWQTALKKIPGATFLLQPYVDEFGNTSKTFEKYGSGAFWLNMAEQFFSPAYRSKLSNTEVDQEIERLGEDVYPSKANKYINFDKQKYNLSADEYTAYATLRGETAYALVQNMIGTDAYNALSDAEKVAAFKDAYTYADTIAKSTILGMRGVIGADPGTLESWVGKANAYANAVGTPDAISQFIAVKQGLKVNGITNRDDRAQFLWQQNIPAENKALLMEMNDGSNGGYAEGTAFYNKKGELVVDFGGERPAIDTAPTAESEAATEAPSSAEVPAVEDKYVEATNTVKKMNAEESTAYLNTTSFTSEEKYQILAKADKNDPRAKNAEAFHATYGLSYDDMWDVHTKYNSETFHGYDFQKYVDGKKGLKGRQKFALVELANTQSAWLEKAQSINSKMGISYDTLWKIKLYWSGESGQGKKARITAYCKKLGLKQSQIDKLYNEYKFLS